MIFINTAEKFAEFKTRDVSTLPLRWFLGTFAGKTILCLPFFLKIQFRSKRVYIN